MRRFRKSWKGVKMETSDGDVVRPSYIVMYCGCCGCCGCCCFVGLVGCR